MLKLANYTLITEVMQISQDFKDDVLSANNDIEKEFVSIEVGIDNENIIQNRLNMVISFANTSGYEELSFYFNLTNQENTEITSIPKSIYDRKVSKQYLPQGLGEHACINKLKEMLTELLKIKSPPSFIMKTYDDSSGEKQISFFNNLVDVILKNGYMLQANGVDKEDNKYFWKFATNHNLAKSKYWKDFTGITRDEAYWERHDKHVTEMWKGMKPLIRTK